MDKRISINCKDNCENIKNFIRVYKLRSNQPIGGLLD